MKQSEFQQLHVTRSKGRKKSRVQGALGFGFAQFSLLEKPGRHF